MSEEYYTIVPKDRVVKRNPFGIKTPKLTSEEFLEDERFTSKKKLYNRVKKQAKKIADRLYLSSTKSMIELIEETSLDGINVVKVGDKVNTHLGSGIVKKILKNKNSIQYGILLQNSLSRIYKSNSLVYLSGKYLKV